MDSTRNSALEHHLLEAGLTPARLAEELGIDEKTVQRWLAGRCRPYPRHQYAVATALHVDRRDLIPNKTWSGTVCDLAWAKHPGQTAYLGVMMRINIVNVGWRARYVPVALTPLAWRMSQVWWNLGGDPG